MFETSTINSQYPLVSIIVVSYNASETIIETLDSIKSQTYSPIELIIADDHSSDDTAIKCKYWLDKNSDRFVNSKLIVNEKNLGVSANLNIGIQASSGEWIKNFGDDILVSDAIEKNVDYAATLNDCNIIVSKLKRFVDKTKKELDTIPTDDYQFPASNHLQYIANLKSKLMVPSPTWFFKRDLYDRLGGFNEHFRLSEDVPFTFKLLESGFFFSYMPKITVLYRVKQNSLSNNKGLTNKQKQPYFESRSSVYYELQVPALKKNKLYGVLIRKNLWFYFYKQKIHSRDHSLARYFYGALCAILS